MYSRSYGDDTFTFEPSGGLLHASLVMRDQETDSYWSILTNASIWGDAKGRHLEILPGAEKTTFGDWRDRNPETLVLSVDDVEHEPKSPYDRYFAATEGFRGLEAADTRLATKADVYGFFVDGQAHAVPHTAFENGGALLPFEEDRIFLYRQADDSLYRSTVALRVPNGRSIVRDGGTWILHGPDGRDLQFDHQSRRFGGFDDILPSLGGFDTFWYIWSLTNPETALHGHSESKPAKPKPAANEAGPS